MSIYTETIIAFNQLLKDKLGLFSTQDWINLNKLLTPLADDTENMSNALSTWCESHSEIDDALSNVQEHLFPNEAKVKGIAGTPPPKITPEDEKKLREQLLNTIRHNSSDPKSKPNSTQSSQT
ncbi:MAG: hypothetical protein QM487_01290 [Candidatus Marithrix sp.]